MALNLMSFIRVFDVKDVGADVPIKISKRGKLVQALSELDHTICDMNSDKEFFIFSDNKLFKNLMYACREACAETTIRNITYLSNEVTLEAEEGRGADVRFDDWRVMLQPLITGTEGRIVIQNTRDNLQVVSERLINALPDGEVVDWHIGNDGVFYVGVDMRIINQKLLEEITLYNTKFDRRDTSNGGLEIYTGNAFVVSGNRELIGKLEDVLENGKVGEYRKYRYAAIYTYVDTMDFEQIDALNENQQIVAIERSIRRRYPEVASQIEVQQVLWTDSAQKAVMFRCRSISPEYLDAPFDTYLKLSKAGYYKIENSNIPIAIGDLNSGKWHLKLFK